MLLPKAQTADILEQETGNELMIYDLRIDKACTLNETSKIVYRACGRQKLDELNRKHKFTADLIHLAPDKLQKNDIQTAG